MTPPKAKGENDIDLRIENAVLKATLPMATNAALATAIASMRSDMERAIAGLTAKVTWVQVTMVGLLATTAGGALLLAFNLLLKR